MERTKVGKDRNPKCSLKKSKSMHTNIMNNSGSGNTLGPNRTSPNRTSPNRTSPNRTSGAKSFRSSGTAVAANYSAEILALSIEVADLKSAMDILEKERDFYFAKLRDIEILCQAPEVMNLSMSVAVKKILYAEDAKESALDEAQDYLNQTMNAIEAEAEIESNYSQN